MRWRPFACGMLLAVSVSAASAQPYTITFEGVIFDYTVRRTNTQDPSKAGLTFSGSIVFDVSGAGFDTTSHTASLQSRRTGTFAGCSFFVNGFCTSFTPPTGTPVVTAYAVHTPFGNFSRPPLFGGFSHSDAS